MGAIKQILHIDRCPLILDGMLALIEQKCNLVVLHRSTDIRSMFLLNDIHEPDLIIFDVKDASADIYDFIRRLSSQDEVRFIALTFSVLQVDINNAIQSGVKGYILKNTPTNVLSEAIDIVMSGQKHHSPEVLKFLADKKYSHQLTYREIEILNCVARGQSNRSIALGMGISEWTVKSHMKNILSKLGACSRTDAISKAVELGIVRYLESL